MFELLIFTRVIRLDCLRQSTQVIGKNWMIGLGPMDSMDSIDWIGLIGLDGFNGFDWID